MASFAAHTPDNEEWAVLGWASEVLGALCMDFKGFGLKAIWAQKPNCVQEDFLQAVAEALSRRSLREDDCT